jgi:hypothetical protein
MDARLKDTVFGLSPQGFYNTIQGSIFEVSLLKPNELETAASLF